VSVYRPQKSPWFAYDFQLEGRRFTGSTRRASRGEAKAVERERRAEARRELDRDKSLAGAPLTLDVAFARYQIEVGSTHAAPDTTLTNLARIQSFFGPGKRLDEIDDFDVARLVAWRRGQTARGRKTIADPADPTRRIAAPLVSAATVNRSTAEVLQKVLNRAARVWGVKLPVAPTWRQHLLREPQERVREVRASEEARLDAVRADYRPLVAFARASGLRLAECLMKKEAVDLAGGYVRVAGKGGRLAVRPITAEMRALLMSEMANPTAFVFTYCAARPRRGVCAKSDRLPITAAGLKSLWRRAKRKKGGEALPADLRFHDLRHDFATKLLRETGNLKLVQRALGHAKIETTTKYAHVLDDEVLAGMEAASKRRRKAP
jgi:integrase